MPGTNGSRSCDDTEEASVVGHVAVKSIPFYRKSPETWFRQMESQFHLSNVKNSVTKYHHILSLLPEEIASDIPEGDPDYDKLKEAVLDGLKANRHQLIEQALAAVELGSRRPTQLVNDIRKRFVEIGLKPDDNIIKSRLLSALPNNIRAALVGHDSAALDDYTKIADSMIAVAAPSTDFTVGAVSSTLPSQREHRSDSREFNRDRDRHDFNSGTRNFYRDRQDNDRGKWDNSRDWRQTRFNQCDKFQPRPFHNGQRSLVCNAHIYYADRARTCRTWCKWPNKPANVLKNGDKTPAQSRPSSPINS